MGIVFGGQAFGGIFASVTNVLVILLGVDPPNAAFFCFLVAVLFLGTALVRAHHIFSRILNFGFLRKKSLFDKKKKLYWHLMIYPLDQLKPKTKTKN